MVCFFQESVKQKLSIQEEWCVQVVLNDIVQPNQLAGGWETSTISTTTRKFSVGTLL